MNTASDFKQWLHAMKMVARLPGGTPPEFRRKLWLALADRHLHTTGIDWQKEETKCLSDDTWLDDDEELGIQIVKDLHRTGSSLFSGPNGNINQAKLKRVLLGYARWNPEVGYCQGFNMLGALILQVMDKNEIEALKVMIYLVEGVLPKGYFSGSLSGLQVDMAVFREILSNRLPKLSKHLQKLQSITGEGAFEPPLTNVFTMQWFLTLFCTCLPKNCVLRVWDLILIEGSDILLRTALAIWGLLEERILMVKTADEFYCKMGTLSGELLNGHLFDSNGLIQKVVDLGPINDLQKMRNKHLSNLAPWKEQKGFTSKALYSDEDGDSDDDSWRFMANARRGSLGLPLINRSIQATSENRERIALDISILKKQYAKLRERQKQAHIILSNAARQTVNPGSNNSSQINVNKYLAGRNAIVSNKGKRSGPPAGAIPPIRSTLPTTNSNTSVPALGKQSKHVAKQAKRVRSSSMDKPNEKERHAKTSSEPHQSTGTLQKSHSTASSTSSISSQSDGASTSMPRHRLRKESSSYSEDDSDHEIVDVNFDDQSSSTSTSLCDDEPCVPSSVDASPLKKRTPSSASNYGALSDDSASSYTVERINSQLKQSHEAINENISLQQNDIMTESVESDRQSSSEAANPVITDEQEHTRASSEPLSIIIGEHASTTDAAINEPTDISSDTILNTYEKELLEEALNLPTQQITSTSQLSPIADIAEYLRYSCISPLKSPASLLYLGFDSSSVGDQEQSEESFEVNEDGVTNEYFERINQVTSAVNVIDDVEGANFVAAAESTEIQADQVVVPTISSEPVIDDAPQSISTESMQAESLHPESPTASVTETQTESVLLASDTGTDKTTYTMAWNYSLPKDYTVLSTEDDVLQKSDITVEPLEILDDNVAHPPNETTVDEPTSFVPIVDSIRPVPSIVTIAPADPDEPMESLDANKNTEKVLQIIAENSKILHRIMNKNISEENARQESQLALANDHQYLEDDDDSLSPEMVCHPNFNASTVNTDAVKWNIDQYQMADQDEVLSSGQNDSPTQSIDHIVNSDSDYTVRNVSICSDIMDKEDTVRDIDNYLNDVVKTSSKPGETAVVASSYSPIPNYAVEAEPITSYRAIDNEIDGGPPVEIPKTESKFAKYIDDVAAGLVPTDDDDAPYGLANSDNNADIATSSTIYPSVSDYVTDIIKEQVNNIVSIDVTLPTNENASVSQTGDQSVDVSTDLTGDISATISSIKNTIKSIDTLCKDDRSKSRDEKLEEIIKRVEQIERTKDVSVERVRPLSLVIEDRFDVSTLGDMTKPSMASGSCIDVESSERTERYLSLPRCSRDRWRDLSPRRRNKEDADFSEYESRAQRTKSPMDNTTAAYSSYSNIRTLDSDIDKYKYDSKISSSSSPQSYVSSMDPYFANKKFEIRHTTVTSTFYDRFLSQKRERRIRMDKSPSSPIITKAYLDSLKPDNHDAYMRNNEDRNTRSAENSPTRKCSPSDKLKSSTTSSSSTSPAPTTKSTHYKPLLFSQYPALNDYSNYTKSCDNIPSRFKHKFDSFKYDGERTATTTTTTATLGDKSESGISVSHFGHIEPVRYASKLKSPTELDKFN